MSMRSDCFSKSDIKLEHVTIWIQTQSKVVLVYLGEGCCKIIFPRTLGLSVDLAVVRFEGWLYHLYHLRPWLSICEMRMTTFLSFGLRTDTLEEGQNDENNFSLVPM